MTTAGQVSATANITGGNVLTGGLVSSTGNVTGGNVLTGGLISATGTITSAANITGGNITTAGQVSATANITGGNVLTGGLVSSTGNVTGGNLTTAGQVTATANITGGNILTAGLISATGTITSAANVIGGNLTTAGQVSATANITGGNILTAGLISATGNITGGNVQGGNIVLTGNSINEAAAGGTITVNGASANTNFAVNGLSSNVFFVNASTNTVSFGSNAQTTNAIAAFNSTNSILIPVGNNTQKPSVGVTGMLRFNSTNNSVEIYNNSGWANVGQQTFTVVADETFTGNGVATTFNLVNSGQTTNGVIVSINGIVQAPTTAYAVTGASGNVLTFTEAPAVGDNIDVRELTTTTSVTSISGTGSNLSAGTNQIDITGNLVPTSNATQTLGNATNYWKSLYVSGNTIYLGGLQLQASGTTFSVYQSDGTTLANVGAAGLSVTSITDGTSAFQFSGLNGNAIMTAGGANTIIATSTGANVAGYLTASGNVTGSYIIGNGSLLTGLPAGYTNSNTATFLAAFGSNTISTTGTINAGNITGGNILAGSGIISTSGNITGGNLSIGSGSSTAGSYSATGNITGGNILAGSGIISTSGNITGGNLSIGSGSSTAGSYSATGNITGGNINTSGTTGILSVNSIIHTGTSGSGNIGASGAAFGNIFATAQTALYADLAEKYVADAEYAPGTVLVFGGTHEVTVDAVDSDSRVAGVVSTDPGFLMNEGLATEFTAAVALTGRVPCFVVGPVRKGDLMVSAGLGRARAEANPRVGTVIGKALENFDGAEGTIEVVVGRF